MKSDLKADLKAAKCRIKELEQELFYINRYRESIASEAIGTFLREDVEDELEALSHGLRRDWRTKIQSDK